MSFLAQVVEDGPDRYVLPRVGTMRCPVTAFLSPALFAQTDEKLWAQAAGAVSYEGATGLYLLPDTHLGYGIPVGGVLVTDKTIVQAGSGYDISCGVIAMQTGLHASDVVDKVLRQDWVNECELRVATGVGSARPRLAAETEASTSEILRHGAKALGVSAALCERQFIPVDDRYFREDRIEAAVSKARPQLGSVGGGNHFIEMQVDEADGSVWIMVHCGSRGYGWQTANYYFYEGARLRGLPPKRREEAFLYADEPLGREYWAHHNSAANFAVANRHQIVRSIREATAEVFQQPVEVYYEISHNLVQEETLLLPDGTRTRGFVHRKGATRAFPAGHPDLVGTPWADTGHPVLIPGSMFHGAAILFPCAGAYSSGCSVNHGSGRQMARGEARRTLATFQGDIDAEMRQVRRTFAGVEIEGVVSNHAQTPLDECSLVYKNLDDVLDVLVRGGIARVSRRLWPVANIKGAD